MRQSLPDRPHPGRRSREKQQAILDSAVSLAAAHGYAAVTIEAVAQRAGVGKQTIYRWWPSKPALFVEAYGYVVPAEDLDIDLGDAAAELRDLLEKVFARFREGPAGTIMAGLIADATHDADAARAVESGLVLGRRELLTRPLQRAVARGELPRDFDADWAAEAIVALIWRRLLLRPDTLDAAFAARLVDYVLGRGG